LFPFFLLSTLIQSPCNNSGSTSQLGCTTVCDKFSSESGLWVWLAAAVLWPFSPSVYVGSMAGMIFFCVQSFRIWP
jgi:hypothetical protein